MALTATFGSASSPATGQFVPKLAIGKWKLPAVLAVALGGVVYFQYGHLFVSEAEAETSTKEAAVEAKLEKKVVAKSTVVDRELNLPEIDLTEALEFDPFAPTPLLGDESPVEIVTAPPSIGPRLDAIDIEPDSALLQKFKATPIQLIYSDSRGNKVAIIGGKAVNVGDSFQGMKVLDITPGGLIVETIEPAEETPKRK